MGMMIENTDNKQNTRNIIIKIGSCTLFTTLATSESCQTGLVPFLKANISRITEACHFSVILLILAFKNATKSVWHDSEVASVNRVLALT